MKTDCTRALLTCLVLSALTSCSSQNGSAPPPTASPTISSVAPTCAPSAVASGATSQCSANVQGTGKTIVEVAMTNGAAFRSFVLGFLDHAEILDPPEVRADMIEWLEAVAAGPS